MPPWLLKAREQGPTGGRAFWKLSRVDAATCEAQSLAGEKVPGVGVGGAPTPQGWRRDFALRHRVLPREPWEHPHGTTPALLQPLAPPLPCSWSRASSLGEVSPPTEGFPTLPAVTASLPLSLPSRCGLHQINASQLVVSPLINLRRP